MKTIFKLTIAALALTSVAADAFGRHKGPVLSTQATEAKLDGDSVRVALDVRVSRRALKCNQTLIFRPVITDGMHKVSLPRTVVYGGHLAKTSYKRLLWSVGENEKTDAVGIPRRKKPLEYRAAVPAQYWMREANLEIESAVSDCCCVNYMENTVVTGNLMAEYIPELRDSVVLIVTKMAPEPFSVPESIADTMSISFPFIAMDEGFDPNGKIKMYDDERDDCLAVYYGASSYTIDPSFSGNARTLDNLLAAIDVINASEDCDVEHIVVGGFASPEGPLSYNDRLAWRRAVAVKEYIVNNTGTAADKIAIFNGSEDWRGLRELVAGSDMEYRDEVLRVIDTVPLWDAKANRGRNGVLMRMHGGRPYKYMSRHFFPLLRNGAFIKVYYENR